MLSERDRDRLETIIELIDHLERRLKTKSLGDFEADKDEQDLAAFRLSHVGENAYKLTNDLTARHPDLPWHAMYTFRNVAFHDYDAILTDYVWAAARNLEPIKAMCLAELADVPGAT